MVYSKMALQQDGEENKESPLFPRIPFLPPSEFEFDNLFFKMFFFRMDNLGYLNKVHQAVHVSFFRRCVRNLIDLVSDGKSQFSLVDVIGSDTQTMWIKWVDIRRSLDSGVKFNEILTTPERVFMVMEGNANSRLGQLWGGLIFIVILGNLVLIIVQSLPSVCPPAEPGEPRCLSDYNTLCVLVFSFEYAVKVACIPFCRRGIFDHPWLLEHVVPDPRNPMEALPTKMSRSQRATNFITSPMNVIDVVAILPFWLGILFSELKVPLGFLRSLRLLRLFRVLKFGKFSGTLMVLGDTFAKSAQSIFVLVLYIAIVSLLGGAVIQQLEHGVNEDPAFESVPSSLWWVAARMVAMQHSLPGVKAVPVTWVSAGIVAFVGMFKGVIFVLPIGQITVAFKEAATAQQTQEQIRQEISLEKLLPFGTEWKVDPSYPCVNVEIRSVNPIRSATCSCDEVSLDDPVVGIGRFNVPLFKATNMPPELISMPIEGKTVPKQCRMEFMISWSPGPGHNEQEKKPSGELTIEAVRGVNFPSSDETQQWTYCIHVPCKLYGDDAQPVWDSPDSSGPARTPTWEGSKGTFDVNWELAGKSPASPKRADSGQEAFQKEVLHLLGDRSAQIKSLGHLLGEQSAQIKSLGEAVLKLQKERL